MNIIKESEIKLDEQFNNMPGKETVENLLVHYLGQNGVSKYKIVDITEGQRYWENKLDTLVIEINPEETYKSGAERVMEFAINLACFVKEIQCDEFQKIENGRTTILRFWWD